MSAILSHLKVAELSHAYAGNLTGMFFANAGADVLKIEPPEGDPVRTWGPPMIGDDSAVFVTLNAGKRSVVADVTTSEGKAQLGRIAASVDVLIEDSAETAYIPPLDYATLLRANPNLIICSISGYGPEGPWRHLPSSELVAQMSSEMIGGLGKHDEAPVRFGSDIASYFTAIAATQGSLAAWLGLKRGRSEGSRRVHVSLFGSMLFLRSTMWAALSNPDDWWGLHLDSYLKPPDHGYQTKDGRLYFVIARINDDDWGAMMRELDLDEILADPETNDKMKTEGAAFGRYAHDYKHYWERAFAEMTSAEAIELLSKYGAYAYPINDEEAVVNSEQVVHLEAIGKVIAPGGAEMPAVKAPARFQSSADDVARVSPSLGQHTAEILKS